MSVDRLLFEDSTPDPKGRPHRVIISARATEDGAVNVVGVYQGALVEECFGDWDHEFGLTIPARHVPSAMIALLAHRWEKTDGFDYSALQRLLTAENIPFENWVWS